MQPLVVADCTRRTGRYNVTLGAVGMIAMAGATISTTATGFLAQAFGFTPAFLVLALIAGVGLLTLWLMLAETVHAAHCEEA